MLSSTTPVSSTPGTSGKMRATRLPGRVTMASLKLMADHSTRTSTSPAGRSEASSSTTVGRMTAPSWDNRYAGKRTGSL